MICLLSCFLGCIRSFCVFSLFVSEKKKKKIMTKRIRSKLKDVDVMLVVAVSGTGFAWLADYSHMVVPLLSLLQWHSAHHWQLCFRKAKTSELDSLLQWLLASALALCLVKSLVLCQQMEEALFHWMTFFFFFFWASQLCYQTCLVRHHCKVCNTGESQSNIFVTDDENGSWWWLYQGYLSAQFCSHWAGPKVFLKQCHLTYMPL